MAELGLEARLPPPIRHTYTGTTGVTVCLHNPVSSRDLETYQFGSIQDLTSEREEWKQLFHLWPGPRQPHTYASPTSPMPVLATGPRSEVTGQVEGVGRGVGGAVLGMPRGMQP